MSVGVNQLFMEKLITKLRASTTLSAALNGEVAADHVVMRRFRRGGEVANHAAMVQICPVVYVWPGATSWSPMTPDNARVEATINATVVQSGYISGTAFEFTDKLVTEVMNSADGTGGSSSFLSPIGTNLRARVATPIEDGRSSLSEVRLNIIFQASLYPGV